MGQIVQVGSVNIASLNVPQVLVQIVPPQFLYGGAQSNIGGIVGTASWGPTNSPQAFGNVTQEAQIFGPTVNRLYDLGGHAILAMAQGANFIYGVRVTDGTDVAASVVVPSTAAVAAKATFTEATTLNFLAGDSVTIGNQTFNIVTPIGVTPGNILVGANTNAGFVATMANIIASAAASIAGGPATANYVPNTTPANFSGAAGNGLTTGATYVFTALTPGVGGNSLASTYTASSVSAGSFGGSTFASGAAAIVGATATAKYTGSLGNSLKVTTSAGSAKNTFKVILSLPGYTPEVFDNIGGTGNAFWIALTAAINSGSSTVRGPSNLATFTAGVGTVLPGTSAVSYTMTGGTDGVSSITTSVLLGTDTLPRTGMYCLRQTGASKAMLADCSDSTSWAAQIAFGLDIACEMISCTPAGDTITAAATEVATAGVDSFTLSIMFGDWVYWIDATNGIPQRMSSPQSCKLGILCALSPQNSPLNKRINGIFATQRSLSGVPYSTSDLQILGASQMDVIGVNQQVGTTYFNCLFGKNTSSNPLTSGDNYTQTTYFLARSLFKIGGIYIGQVQTPDEQQQAQTSILQFLAGISVPVAQGGPGILSSLTGGQPYQVVMNSTNAALGFQGAYVKAVYGPIVLYFIFSLEGGASVIASTTPPSQNQMQ